jgi:hypothetical protein
MLGSPCGFSRASDTAFSNLLFKDNRITLSDFDLERLVSQDGITKSVLAKAMRRYSPGMQTMSNFRYSKAAIEFFSREDQLTGTGALLIVPRYMSYAH